MRIIRNVERGVRELKLIACILAIAVACWIFGGALGATIDRLSGYDGRIIAAKAVP